MHGFKGFLYPDFAKLGTPLMRAYRPYARLSIDQVSFPQWHLKMRKGRGKTLKKSSPGFSYKE